MGRFYRGFDGTCVTRPGLSVLAVILSFVASLFAVTLVVPQRAAATIANEDAILEAANFFLYVSTKWDFQAFECVEVRVYANSIIKDTSFQYCDSSGTYSYTYYSSVPETGQWSVQIWSNSLSTERWAKSWDFPSLDMATSVTPSTGGIGTTFVIWSVFTVPAGGPDVDYGAGPDTGPAGPT